MNPMKIMQAKAAMNQFEKRHPKLPLFMDAVKNTALTEGTVIEIKVSTPQGKNYVTNLKLTKEDVELLKQQEKLGTPTK